MRILILSQYFWPENFIINDIANELSKRGHQITVLTSKPNYPEGYLFKSYTENPSQYDKYNLVNIIRVFSTQRRNNKFSLFFNYITFPLSASYYIIFKINKHDFDIVFTFQPSPIFSSIPALFFKFIKKTPYVIWVQDLWPETLLAMGFRKNTLLYKTVYFLSLFIYKNSKVLIVQSDSFRKNLERKIKNKIYVIPNYCYIEPQNLKTQNATVLYRDTKSFNIMFTGNLGTAQDIESIFKAILILKKDRYIKWHFVGSGRMLDWLNNKIQEENLYDIVFTYGNHPIEKMPSFIKDADCLLLSLKASEIFSLTIPAKLQFYLKCGLPILAMIDGEAAKIIKKSKTGFVTEATNYLKLVQNIKKLRKLNKKELVEISKNGISYSNKYFNRDTILQQINDLIKSNCNFSLIKEPNKPKFLILLAVFNGAKYLPEQIKSILDQNDVDIEILISIDKSSDDSMNLCKAFSESDRRVSILNSRKISGSASLNFFDLLLNTKKFKFDYISLADQDDVWDSDKLIRAYSCMKLNRSNAYSSNVFAFWNSNNKFLVNKSQPFRRYDFLFESAGPGCTYVFDKKTANLIYNFLSNANQELLCKIKYHDWLIYALVRYKNLTWFIDKRPSMLYRQHKSNVIGARIGLKAYYSRVKTIFSGVGFEQHIAITNILGIESSYIINSKKRLLIGIFKPYLYRRRFLDQIYFSLVCLFFFFNTKNFFSEFKQ